MTYEYYLTDIHTGQIGSRINLGNVSWSKTVGDSSLTTKPGKKVGKDEVSQVDVKWAEIPGDTPRRKYEAIEPDRKGIVMMEVTDEDRRRGLIGQPIIWGGISNHTPDTRDGTTIQLDSIYSMLASRFVIREGDFTDNRAKQVLGYSKMTMRGIMAEVGRICFDMKPGGSAPVDWNYLGEQHKRQPGEDNNLHARSYWAWNVQNLSGQDVFDKLTGVLDGVDCQWRPYLTTSGDYVRNMFIAGTDEEKHLPFTGRPITFTSFNGGGNLDKVSIDNAQAISRWYGTGAGQDAETLTYMAQDLSMVNGTGHYMLREQAYSDTDADNLDLLKNAVDGKLDTWRRPIMQVSGRFNINDPTLPRLSLINPGEPCYIDLYDWPDLPDGHYPSYIEELSGDGSDMVHVKFSVQTIPYFSEEQ